MSHSECDNDLTNRFSTITIIDMANYEGSEDPYEEEDAALPDNFFDKKWPHPKLHQNRPTGKDEALVWFINFYKERWLEEFGVDISDIGRKNR